MAPIELALPPLQIYSLRGTCVAVTDGSRLVIKTKDDRIRVKLAGMTSLSPGRPYREEGIKFLRWLCLNHQVTLLYSGINLDGEYVGTVYSTFPHPDLAAATGLIGAKPVLVYDRGQVRINWTLARNGAAQRNPEYVDRDLEKYEQQAQAQKLGMFQPSLNKASPERHK